MAHADAVAVFTAVEVDKIIGWVRAAGNIARRYFRNVVPERKADHTFLTQADVEIEKFLVQQIRATYPNHTVIGEEGTRGNLDHQTAYIWAIDPIDGTTVFVQGLPGWGISMGVLDRAKPAFGLFYMPLVDDLTYTGADGVVYCNECALTDKLRQDWADKGFLAINSTAHHDFHIDLKRTRALGSVGTNLVYTARGKATASLITKASLWDLVAGAAILQGVGGELRYLSGKPIDYLALLNGQQVTEPVIAGHPVVLDQLQGQIAPRS
jgi:myo-inositol-1(or 4)-monophosphatase